MTEDDTFRKLRKPSFGEMARLWIQKRDKLDHTNTLDFRFKEMDIFLRQYGWTTYDYFFQRAVERRLGD